ncbi:hypothetical protein CANINC_000424 [Pichia inconspicua]|uniref:Glutamyl-tRNA(Gln) amidotransferase subunit B, mitochondrial n=1 Tax=Pichia inconspicua TaxID=52247 RepID=A0A4T0X669_9ASCO|nr:hypothetical protein CANINC_000424 [[Candida] inconspicua]
MSKPQLKIGLEIHTQLNTLYKLFSNSPNSTSNLNVQPNTSSSFFDISLPGTQPKLNTQCLLNTLKLATALNCEIPTTSSFDRKHYFYGDQPLGYQITQHFHPIAKNGIVPLFKRHHPKIKDDLIVHIQQLQLEQDTGRSIYHSTNSSLSFINFNRTNIPLIELVTLPDFSNLEQVRSFLHTYIKLVQDLNICTGDLETGALRVDVNINLSGFPRVELKNLPTISAILNAIKFEEKRQLNALNSGNIPIDVETRGWNGTQTYHLRSKESSVDYRYVPDMELPKIKIHPDLKSEIKSILPKPIHERLDDLIATYNLPLRDAKILLNNDNLRNYYEHAWNLLAPHGKKIQNKLVNWLVHDLLGILNKDDTPLTLPVTTFVDLITIVESGTVSKSNGKLLLMHLVHNSEDHNKPITDLAKEFDMIMKESDVSSIVQSVLTIESNAKILKQIREGNKGKLNYLIGQCMRASNGNVKPQLFEQELHKILNN